MNINFMSKLLGNLALFVFAVTLLWLAYRAVHHAIATKFSFKDWVNDLASVNTRMTVALALFTITILVLLAAVVINAGGVFRADLDESTIRYILLAEMGAMGWDVIGFIGKRATFRPGAPDDRDDEPPPPDPAPAAPAPLMSPVRPTTLKPTSPNEQQFSPRPAFTPEGD